jgi:hypothetical protein
MGAILLPWRKRVPDLSPWHRPRDHEPLHLARPLANQGQARVAIRGELAGIAAAAAELHRLVGTSPGAAKPRDPDLDVTRIRAPHRTPSSASASPRSATRRVRAPERRGCE